jgi:60 kDa SS-A/Ro ribonucleoprotein
MSSNNLPAEGLPRTHGGALAFQLTPFEELRRTVLSCMLWEKEHYESGSSIAARIKILVPTCNINAVADLAREARNAQHLRHVPLLLVREMVRSGHGRIIGDTLADVIQRPDEITEFLAIYWKDGKCPIAKQVKLGLARAFRKFDEYQFAKYDQGNAIKLRDVLFLVHGKPKAVNGHYATKHQRSRQIGTITNGGDLDMKATPDELLYRAIVDHTLKNPDTWEVKLSAGEDKKESFTDLLKSGKLGYMALLRNLRKMTEEGVDRGLIAQAIEARRGASKVLPFRFISAAREAPQFESALEKAFVDGLQELPKIRGRTIIVLDVSGSMKSLVSNKSTITRLDAGAALCAILREQCEDPVIYATAGVDRTRLSMTALLPSRHGMSLIAAFNDAYRGLGGGGIFLKPMLEHIQKQHVGDIVETDRIVVVTDEQDCAISNADSPTLAEPFGYRNYLINVASYKYGVGYGKWLHIDGFSEATIDFIRAVEAQS